MAITNEGGRMCVSLVFLFLLYIVRPNPDFLCIGKGMYTTPQICRSAKKGVRVHILFTIVMLKKNGQHDDQKFHVVKD